MIDLVKQAKIGSIVPVYKELNEEIDAIGYFTKLSNYGNKKNSIFMETTEKSFGSANPCLMLIGKDDDFEITPLNNLGKKFISLIKKDLKFCDKATFSKGKIYGTLTKAKNSGSEEEKLKLKTHLDIIRAIAFKFNPTTKPITPYCGLFGLISSNFVHQIEDIPKIENDLIDDPDYILYFLDNMFIVDHKNKKTYFVANALITDNQKEKTYKDCIKIINNYENLISKKIPKGKKPKKKEFKISYDTSDQELSQLTGNLKKQINEGNIIYAAPSRLTIVNYIAEPLDLYSEIKINNPGSTMLYINDGDGISISSGATSFLNVFGNKEKKIELDIYTEKISRGIIDEEIDPDLDNKYEAKLKADEAKINYNIILVDSIRDDIARISVSGSRNVSKLLEVEKLPKSQYLRSKVVGTLNKDLDALHAYLATINPIIGIPKIKSMQLLSRFEKNKSSFTQSSVVYISPEKDLNSMTIEPIRIKKSQLYFSSSFNVFNNSKNEFKESQKDTNLLKAIKSAGGFK